MSETTLDFLATRTPLRDLTLDVYSNDVSKTLNTEENAGNMNTHAESMSYKPEWHCKVRLEAVTGISIMVLSDKDVKTSTE